MLSRPCLPSPSSFGLGGGAAENRGLGRLCGELSKKVHPAIRSLGVRFTLTAGLQGDATSSSLGIFLRARLFDDGMGGSPCSLRFPRRLQAHPISVRGHDRFS